VSSIDPRLHKIELTAQNSTMSALLESFFRPSPQMQQSSGEVKRKTAEKEFAGQYALIIGGSRGLGEITAKIIAAGGGHVIISYIHGEKDALRIAQEINGAGGSCDVVQCDIRAPHKAIETIAKRKVTVTHVYYFASPKIFLPKTGLFNTNSFQSFTAFYVDGLFRTYRACRRYWQTHLTLFYPSTVAIDEKDRATCEYALAKIAGESLCAYLAQYDPNLSIVIERLPRIATDQTVSIMKFPAQNALDSMIPIVRKLHCLQ
jgi:hypothetical protein